MNVQGEHFETASALLVALPKLIWRSEYGGRRRPKGHERQRIINRRLGLARENQWEQLIQEALAMEDKPPSRVGADAMADDEKARRLQRGAMHSMAAKTWRILDGPGLAPAEPASWQAAVDKLCPRQEQG